MLNSCQVSLALGFLAIAMLPNLTSGQGSTSTHPIRKAWPAPVRGVAHAEPIETETSGATDEVETQGFFGHRVPMNGLRSLQPPHHVLQSPGRTKVPGKHPLGNQIASKRAVHPPHSQYKRRFQPTPAVIPYAGERETWKTPYSYGYFGASGSRHWSMHHGHRDRYTEWRLQ